MQFSNPHWRRELASWMHPRRKGDGLVVPEITGLVTRAVVSAVNVGRSVAGKDETLATDAPVVAILSTDRDDPARWLEAGRIWRRDECTRPETAPRCSWGGSPSRGPGGGRR